MNVTRFAIVMAALCGLTMLSGVLSPTATAAVPDSNVTVLAIVDGDTVYSSDLDRLLIQTHRSMAMSERQSFDYEKLLTRLVNERLLVHEALALGIDEDQSLLNQLEQERKDRAARLWARDNFKPSAKVPEDTVLQYFRDNFYRVAFRMIASRTAEESEAVRKKILAGMPMDSVARASTIDNYKGRAGLHGPLWYVDIEPEVRSLTDTLPVGQLSAVFPYRSVFAVARVEEVIPADTSELHLVRAQIETWFTRQANERAWRAFLEPLRQKFPVVDMTAALDRIRADSANLFTPEYTVGTADVVMRVGAIDITDQEFRTELSHDAMLDATASYDALFAKTYEDLSTKHTVTAAAYAAGYDQRPDVVAAYNRSMDSALVAICIAETVNPRIVFSHAEFAAYQKEHPDEFRRPDQLQFDEMTVDSQSVAEEIYQRLKDGAEFEYLARQYNARRPSEVKATEYVDVSKLPQDLQDQVKGMGLHGIPRPLQTDDGWLIVRIRNRRPGEELSPEEADMRLRNIMYQMKFNEQMDSVLSILRSNAEIQYNEDAIRAYFGKDS